MLLHVAACSVVLLTHGMTLVLQLPSDSVHTNQLPPDKGLLQPRPLVLQCLLLLAAAALLLLGFAKCCVAAAVLRQLLHCCCCASSTAALLLLCFVNRCVAATAHCVVLLLLPARYLLPPCCWCQPVTCVGCKYLVLQALQRLHAIANSCRLCITTTANCEATHVRTWRLHVSTAANVACHRYCCCMPCLHGHN
jgi:hypothetical protein